MGKKFKKIASVALPIAASFIPGVGPAIGTALGAGATFAPAVGGAVLGAGGGLLSGGGLKGALAGGLTGGAASGGGTLLGNALGATGAASTALGSGILGAGAGGLLGGGKGALLGGALGGLGGYANAGGFSGLGDSLGLTGDDGILSGIGNVTDSLGITGNNGVFSNITNSLGITNGNAGYNPGDVIAGDIGTTGTLTNAGAGAGMSSFGNIGNLLSGYLGTKANDDAEEALLAAQQRSLGAIQPYLNAKFDPGDLTKDTGYQFRLQQGQQGLDRSLGARGSLFSGAALKAGADYNQSAAASEYNAAYQRFLAQNQQNLGAAGMAAGIYDNQGNIQANAGVNNSNVLNRTISGLFGNGAFGNTGQSMGGLRVVGVDPRTGQPIYA